MSEELLPLRETKDYFSNLTLADIYGKLTVPLGTEIVTDIPYGDWYNHYKEDDALQKKELMERYSIPSIASFSSGSEKQKKYGFLVVHPGPTPALTHWLPCFEERRLIAELSLALTDRDKPLIAEFGCGTAFLSKLLASERLTRVLGVDIDEVQMRQLPPTEGELDLVVGDVYDIWRIFSPQREPTAQREITKIIDEITLDLRKNAKSYASRRRIHNMDSGPKGRFAKRLKKLNEVAWQRLRETPLDLVVCSFMQPGVEMTIPIRDGILPKCIIYVRPENGISGVTDHYFCTNSLGMSSAKIVDWVSSYNPGRNYRTVARWRTIWQDNWQTILYGLSASIGAEMIVQLRKDVKIWNLPGVEVRHFHWDDEIKEIMRRPNLVMLPSQDQDDRQNFESHFTDEIEAARNNLFSI